MIDRSRLVVVDLVWSRLPGHVTDDPCTHHRPRTLWQNRPSHPRRLRPHLRRQHARPILRRPASVQTPLVPRPLDPHLQHLGPGDGDPQPRGVCGQQSGGGGVRAVFCDGYVWRSSRRPSCSLPIRWIGVGLGGKWKLTQVDFGEKQITVNAIAPGGVKTDMYVEAARKYIPGGENWSDEQVDKAVNAFSPLGRVGYPEDIAKVVVWLASDDAGWVNGMLCLLLRLETWFPGALTWGGL